VVEPVVSDEVKSGLVAAEGTAAESAHAANHHRAGRAVRHVFSLVLLEEKGRPEAGC
jgi:hypothetical protein